MKNIFESEGLVAKGALVGAQLREGLLALQERVPAIGDVRGLGCMLAIELVPDRASREPDPDLALRVVDQAREGGLLLLRSGPHKNVVRFLPPLVATREEIDRGIEILGKAIDQSLISLCP